MGRPRSDISERIVRAARVRFLHEGVDGASQRRIAREAGTNLGMVYYYFPTKDQLFLAVIEEVYAPMLADIARALGDDVPVEARIHRLYLRLAALTVDEVDILRIVIREALVSNERRRKVVARFMEGHVGLLIQTVVDGVSSGTFRSIEPPLFLVAAIGGIGLFPQILRRLIGTDIAPFVLLPVGADFARTALDVLLHGIGRTAKPSRRRAPKKQVAKARRN